MIILQQLAFIYRANNLQSKIDSGILKILSYPRNCNELHFHLIATGILTEENESHNFTFRILKWRKSHEPRKFLWLLPWLGISDMYFFTIRGLISTQRHRTLCFFKLGSNSFFIEGKTSFFNTIQPYLELKIPTESQVPKSLKTNFIFVTHERHSGFEIHVAANRSVSIFKAI